MCRNIRCAPLVLVLVLMLTDETLAASPLVT